MWKWLPFESLNEYFGLDFVAGEEEIHVLVKLPPPKRGLSSGVPIQLSGPLPKRLKIAQKDVAYKGPVSIESFSVPMETIHAYQNLHDSFTSSCRVRPMCLLYGSPQFGKTTIAFRLWNLLNGDPSVLVIYRSLSHIDVSTEESFWLALSRRVGESAKSTREFDDMLYRLKKRLCLIIDDLDVMFANSDLTSNFMDVLRSWQGSLYFHGFLGIGSYNIVNIYKYHKEDRHVGPFNMCDIVKAKRFSAEQMSSFFKLIEPSHCFPDSTRCAIMDYSAGAPGVFGSLIRFSIDHEKYEVERHESDSWFKIHKFYAYLSRYSRMYSRIQDALKSPSESEWKVIAFLLQDASDIFRFQFGAEVDKLLQLGIFNEEADGSLAFSSEVMRRVCLETLPIREINQVVSGHDPLELLAVSLQCMITEAVKRYPEVSREFPSESICHFELYASIRGLLRSSNIATTHILVEAPGKSRILDIIFSNGVSYGYLIKMNLLTTTEITAAVEQADEYRKLQTIDAMVLVNFVPRDHEMDRVYQADKYSDVKIVHVRYPDSCREFEMELQGQGGVERRVIQRI